VASATQEDPSSPTQIPSCVRRQPVPDDGRVVSLDAGARATARRPETHGETLARILRTGEANVGASL